VSDRSARVAVVGSGPAGFYAAGQLLSTSDVAVGVDMFERLPTPWGLVRAGVAPDHPKIKSVTRVYEATARKPGFRFFGNIEIGTDISPDELAVGYDAVIYAVGTPTGRRLSIPGEALPGSHAATAFVAWYNGHPDHADHAFDLDVRRAVVIGNGNVALYVARMLALAPSELGVTDTADHAIEALARSRVEEIVVLGRRGPAQAAFTNPELRELGELEDADVVVDPADAVLDEYSSRFLESDAANATARRNVELIAGYAARPPVGKAKRIVLRFLGSPVRILGEERVEGVRIERNELVACPDGSLSAQPTGATEDLEAGLVLRSIGYVGSPIPGVPFDGRRGTIRNVDGRVTGEDGTWIPGLYTAGWVKRGPSGVIGTNKKCAQETVRALLADLAAGRLPVPASDPDRLIAQLRARGATVVDYSGWEAIDTYERGRGEPLGRPRVKLVRRPELLQRSVR
jgi:ferredoxin--NADP+ reductase